MTFATVTSGKTFDIRLAASAGVVSCIGVRLLRARLRVRLLRVRLRVRLGVRLRFRLKVRVWLDGPVLSVRSISRAMAEG